MRAKTNAGYSSAAYPQWNILGSTFLFLPIFLSTYHFHLSGNRTPVSDWNKRFVRSFASLNFFSHSGHERLWGSQHSEISHLVIGE